ncbi:MAG: glycogen debranching enzyme N-terminal domain-containing protein, partial [Chloroflexota bacterium]|nr:glycogen debranching enzyme N-terminal domain-containing protein [Chloroflexota bacterium]
MPPSLDALLSREWLCTNGLGGYASSTFAGCNTRRYHGLLVAALQPPVGRTLLLSKLDETLWVGPSWFDLGTNEYHDGTIQPDGYRYLSEVKLELGIPTWTFTFPGWRLEKKVWMEHEQNTTFVRYALAEAASACRLELAPLCAFRDFHSEQHGSPDWQFRTWQDERGWRIEAYDGAQPYWLACDHPAGLDPQADWYWQFLHREERERGLDYLEDLFRPGTMAAAIVPLQPVLIRASTEAEPAPFAGALERAEERARTVIASGFGSKTGEDAEASPVRAQLLLAADQFIVRRDTAVGRGSTIVAGYHWFGDWGRDSMISLPGLTLTTGRLAIAREILTTFAALVSEGLLPNLFAEQGAASFNTADATLWFFHAIDCYLRAGRDPALLAELFPTLDGIIQWHLQGTRYHIHVDPADSLLYAGEPGVQITWMDAKIGDWVVTPRIGKPVEINALWFNAICLMAAWARELQLDASEYQRLATEIGASFRRRFWYAAGNSLYDVVDGPEGNDSSLRPNQILAVSLPFAPIFGAQAKTVVDAVSSTLLTPFGLRSLAGEDPRYVARYSGDVWLRDGSYHQGTVWPWLIGPFIDAHVRVYQDRTAALKLLEPLLDHLSSAAGLGTISEIFDGD